MKLREQLGDWYDILSPEFQKDYMINIGKRLSVIKDLQPSLNNVFRVFRECPPDKVKVIVIGQDPYFNGTADGLAFSTKASFIPASLKVIFTELERSGYGRRENPDLTDWAKQGVFLINTSLSTVLGIANAHSNWGWERFVGKAIEYLCTKKPMVVMAWGSSAQSIERKYVKDAFVLRDKHPAAGLYNSGIAFRNNHFRLANEYLIAHGKNPIRWT